MTQLHPLQGSARGVGWAVISSGKDLLPYSFIYRQNSVARGLLYSRHQSVSACQLKAILTFQLHGGPLQTQFAKWQPVSSKLERRKESFVKTDITILCNVIAYIPLPLLCSIDEKQVTGSTYTQGQRMRKGMSTRRQRLWGPPWGLSTTLVYPSPGAAHSAA